ncbi:hypothetical protein GF374_03425 [Candidatus Woesearchaeota archaeon]|nr:hypothetical protein [Candidatus Woesearchaeota archaeon]
MKVKGIIEMDIYEHDRRMCLESCHGAFEDCDNLKVYKYAREDGMNLYFRCPACIDAEWEASNLLDLEELERAKATGNFDEVWKKRNDAEDET